MKRKDFLKLMGIGALSLPMLSSMKKLENLSTLFDHSERMPVLFLGHGSPMNGIEDNEFVQGFKKQREYLQKPNAIIVISAHWETRGTYVTAVENPRTIHDFGGFPKELYEVQYPAPGHPALAQELGQMIQPENTVQMDHQWGLDHGSWTVIKPLFPEADIPVLQLSIDYTKPAAYHYELAGQLKKLRERGVLLVGSGNIVHNLGKVAWDKAQENYAYDWAMEASEKSRQWILDGNHKELIDFRKQGRAFDLAIPTPEHYLPLLYTLGLQDNKDQVSIFNDKPLAGSLTMTSVRLA
ncbi:4,5-DOPA dioxygenase extradiol [bacterium SCSIO 12741]|nr:4,5-DOPA dioxygenase extradiol [bacterium SCSIO 12741]